MKTRLILAHLETKTDSERTIVLSCKGKNFHIRLSPDMWSRIFEFRVTNVGTYRLLSEAEYGHLYVQIPAGYDPLVWYFASEQLPIEVMAPIIDEMTARKLEELDIETGSVVLEQQQPIAKDIRISIWQRDGGKCVRCGSQEELDIDHIQAPSQGGSDQAGNLQILCSKCRRKKRDQDGNLILPDSPSSKS